MVSFIGSCLLLDCPELIVSEDVGRINCPLALCILHVTVADLRLSLTFLPLNVVIIALTRPITVGLLARGQRLIERLRLSVQLEVAIRVVKWW